MWIISHQIHTSHRYQIVHDLNNVATIQYLNYRGHGICNLYFIHVTLKQGQGHQPLNDNKDPKIDPGLYKTDSVICLYTPVSPSMPEM